MQSSYTANAKHEFVMVSSLPFAVFIRLYIFMEENEYLHCVRGNIHRVRVGVRVARTTNGLLILLPKYDDGFQYAVLLPLGAIK